MGVAHHSHYLLWFEMGRTELLRDLGISYREMEEQGIYLPVVEVACRYRSPVRYDDLLQVETALSEIAASRIIFGYVLRRLGAVETMAEGRTVHATVNREGEVIRLPETYRDLLVRS